MVGGFLWPHLECDPNNPQCDPANPPRGLQDLPCSVVTEHISIGRAIYRQDPPEDFAAHRLPRRY